MNIELIEYAKKYKTKTASRYLPIATEEITSKIMKSETYGISAKYDGHLYLMSFENGRSKLANHGGNVIEDLPLNSEANKLLKDKCEDVVLAGELYLFKDGKRTRSFDLASALDDKSENIHFAAFDVLLLDGEEFSMEIKTLNDKLSNLLENGKAVHKVKTNFVESRKDILELYKEIVEEGGYEGIVVRTQNGPTYKVKPKITIDGVILGYAESEGVRSGMLKEVLIGVKSGKNEFLLLTKVSNGYTIDERKKLLKELEKNKAGSDYIEVAGSNVAFIMVKPNLVMEFSCLDIFNENSKGVISKMNLNYKDEVYHSIGKKASASVISPVFIKLRTDKKVSMEDTGINQLTKIISLERKTVISKNLNKSELIKREVYLKESKGKKMVRKFIVWKTNKEETGGYPAYVFHYTDFSPGRSEILKKEIKVSNSKVQIEEIFKNELADNVKKGWKKV